jgi:ankyrin repeat protein
MVNDKLINACETGDFKTVKSLVQSGADIHAYDDCALRWAAESGHLEIVKFLVEQGANIHALDDYALRWAAQKDHLEIVNYLKLVKNLQSLEL